MAPLLYKKDASPACRAVLLTAKALELEMDYKDVDMFNKEHLDAEFVEMNPQHTIPFLDDDGFHLVDSHAISGYLVGKYGEDDSLYPKEVEPRALIDHKLHFDNGVLQTLIRQILKPIIYDGEKCISEQMVDNVIEAYGFCESFLQDKEWLVGECATIADLSVIASISTLSVLVPIDADVYPKLTEWIARCEELPYYEANSSGLEEFKTIYETLIV